MEKNTVMQNLHKKSVSGKSLTESEKSELEKWYAEQDGIENELFNSDFSGNDSDETKNLFQSALKEISESKNKIAKIASQNELLHRENETLREKLNKKQDLKAA